MAGNIPYFITGPLKRCPTRRRAVCYITEKYCGLFPLPWTRNRDTREMRCCGMVINLSLDRVGNALSLLLTPTPGVFNTYEMTTILLRHHTFSEYP